MKVTEWLKKCDFKTGYQAFKPNVHSTPIKDSTAKMSNPKSMTFNKKLLK